MGGGIWLVEARALGVGGGCAGQAWGSVPTLRGLAGTRVPSCLQDLDTLGSDCSSHSQPEARSREHTQIFGADVGAESSRAQTSR